MKQVLTEDAQMIVGTVQNLVSTVTLCLRYVHPCHTA